jgi:hypothetical protein
MSAAKVFLEYLRGLDEAKRMLRAGNVVLPFVVFAAVQCLVLLALASFPFRPFSAFMVPVVEWLGGPNALHYPSHYLLLPEMYHRVYLPLVATVGFALFGWAVFMMGDRFAREGARVPTAPPLARSLPAMVVVGVVYVAAATAVPALFTWLGGLVSSDPIARLVNLAGALGSVAVQALMVYALLFIRTAGSGPVDALRRSAACARPRFAVTALLLLTVVLAHLPIDSLLAQPDKVVLKFKPELVLYLLAAGVVVELITSYILFAATTSLVLSRREDAF